MRPITIAALLTLQCVVGPALATAQTGLETAVGLYAAAAYEDALAALDRLPRADAPLTDRAMVDQVRMLCLLALNRPAEAEQAIMSLLDGQPTYQLDETDASPRVLRVFKEVRRRALPEVLRRRYRDAKQLYDSKQFEQAGTAFAVVLDLAADSDITTTSDPALPDLIQLARGFAELTAAALETEARRAAEARAAEIKAAEARTAPAAAPSVGPAAAVDPSSGIFDALSPDVVPPVVEHQEIGRWVGSLRRPLAGTNLGSVEVVIDEAGSVTEAAIRTSVSGFYDAILLESAKQWRYKPATRQGRPVKFRRVIAVVAGG